jgi:hypothetical protein
MNGLAPTRTGHCPYSSADQSQSSLRFRKCYPESNTGFSGGSIENALLSPIEGASSFTLIARLGPATDTVKEWGSVLCRGVRLQGFSPISLLDREGGFLGSTACIGLLNHAATREQQAKPIVSQRLDGSAVCATRSILLVRRRMNGDCAGYVAGAIEVRGHSDIGPFVELTAHREASRIKEYFVAFLVTRVDQH